MIIDFSDLKERVNGAIISRLDHTNLNEKFDTPTAEIMVEDIFAILKQSLWVLNKIYLKRVRLWETDTSWAQVEE